MSRSPDWIFGTEPIEIIQELFGPGRPLPFRGLSLLGDTWGMILVVGLAAWWYGRREMYSLIGIVSLGAAAKLLLTSLFDVSRPSGPEIVVYDQLEVGSFPSGHVFEAVGPWGQLYALGLLPLWAPVLVAVLVGLGRLYLGAHYVGDVVAAWVLGAFFVWGYSRAWPHLLRWASTRPAWLRLGTVALALVGTLLMMFAVGGNARRFEIYGMVIGAVIALVLRRRYLLGRSSAVSGPHAWSTRAAKLGIGAAGIVACLLWDRSQSEEALLLGALTAGLATVWALLLAPALFQWLGLGREGMGDERRMEQQGTALVRR